MARSKVLAFKVGSNRFRPPPARTPPRIGEGLVTRRRNKLCKSWLFVLKMVKYSSRGGFWDNHVHASPYFMYQMKHRCRHGYDQLKGKTNGLCVNIPLAMSMGQNDFTNLYLLSFQ